MGAALMRHALVTGGTGGIGASIAHALAESGFSVVATGVTDAEVATFKAAENARAVRLDVTSDSEVEALIETMPELDVLVNCAGIILRGGAEFSIEAFQRTIDVNLVGTMRMCLAAKAKLAQAQGSIVNAASMLSFFGSPFAPGYSASKGGVAQLTKSLAAAWAQDGIRVNAIAPGWIETELTRPLVEDESRSAAILARTPMGRWGKPDDLGGVVRFLVSDEARFVTGVILPVDGGYLTL
jgi:NAD(P)-dependent dehydrogenase (short-subunit alcohol dehydrogenase family)